MFNGENADPGCTQIMVQRTAENVAARLAGEIEMRNLGQSMDPGVGAPSAVDGHYLAAEIRHCGFESLLYRQSLGLALPTDQTGAVILDRQLVTGHGSRVPMAIG